MGETEVLSDASTLAAQIRGTAALTSRLYTIGAYIGAVRLEGRHVGPISSVYTVGPDQGTRSGWVAFERSGLRQENLKAADLFRPLVDAEHLKVLLRRVRLPLLIDPRRIPVWRRGRAVRDDPQGRHRCPLLRCRRQGGRACLGAALDLRGPPFPLRRSG